MKKKPDRPTPRAVALRYDGRTAPRVTAKGAGEVADNILAVAREHGIPLYENAPLATLLGRLDLGAEIPAALYTAVAEVIAFAYHVSGKTPFDTPGNLKE